MKLKYLPTSLMKFVCSSLAVSINYFLFINVFIYYLNKILNAIFVKLKIFIPNRS